MSQQPTANSLQLTTVGCGLWAVGFTLLEMAVVLSIIGLIVGGITLGTNLIRTQQVRQVLSDARTYAVAVQQFRQQYSFLPGDFPTATSIWGDDATNCADAAITNGSPGTCNGDGDGLIETGSANATAENFQAWKQLMLGRYITGNYSGLAGSAATAATPGTNIPASSLKGSGFYWFSGGVQTSATNYYDADYDNSMLYGAAVTADWPSAAALTPKEANDIDTKADDGYPGFGDIVSFKPAAMANCASSATAASAAYSLSYTAEACSLFFLNTFAEAKQ